VTNVEAAMHLGAALKALVDNGHLSLSGGRMSLQGWSRCRDKSARPACVPGGSG
jgi:hypothetical protein